MGLERLVLIVQFVSPGTLSVLSKLTKLQHLNLPLLSTAGAAEVIDSDADRRAATASSQLTFLSIAHTSGNYPDLDQFLFADSELPNLAVLQAKLDMLGTIQSSSLLVSCCPGLQDLLLLPADNVQGPLQEDEETDIADMLECWQVLTKLTKLELHVCVGGMPINFGSNWGS